MRQGRRAKASFAIAGVALFVASTPHAQPTPKTNHTTLPAGWALPIGARGRSPNTVYRPINVAALRAVPKSRCSPVEVAPSVWVTPLCAPMPQFSRSLRATPRPITFRAGKPPETVDLRGLGLEGPIKDQQQAGVCWSFAISTVMDNALRRVGKTDVFAPLHIIAQDEWELLWDKGAGRPIVGEVTWPYDPIKACKLDEHLANEHYCKDAYGIDGGSWRSDPDLVRERNQAESSGSYKIIGMHPLASKPGNVDEITSVLAGGQNIWVAIELNMTSWTNSHMDAAGQIRDWEPDGTGGHAVTISGYRTIDGGKRQFLVHNSWGMSWGDNGYAWISERMMKERLNDAFVLTLGDSAGNPLSPAAPASFGAEDNGKTVTLKRGQSFVVALTSNPSTGLDWFVKNDGGLGAPASDTESDPDQAGGRARRKFTWTNAATGTHVVELEYRRGSDAPARTFRLTIAIGD